MATRDPYVAVSGSTAQASGVNEWAKGWLFDVTSASVQSSTFASETAITDLTATITVEANRRLLFGGIVHAISTVDQDNIRIRVYRDATGVDATYFELDTNATTTGTIFGIDTPSAGTYTYTVKLLRTAGTGTITLTGAFGHRFYCEDIGAAS